MQKDIYSEDNNNTQTPRAPKALMMSTTSNDIADPEAALPPQQKERDTSCFSWARKIVKERLLAPKEKLKTL